MPAKNLRRTSVEGSYCHIYNKGVEKRVIFNDNEDYEVFLKFLKEYLTPPQDEESIKKDFTIKGKTFRGKPHQAKNYYGKVELVAYNLMPDHFHLLIHQRKANSIENLLRSLSTRYSIYFNKKYQRTGSLFDGPYKSIEVKDNPQISLLAWYLHQGGNHSSSDEYMGKRKTSWIKEAVDLKRYRPGKEEKAWLQNISLENTAIHLETNHFRQTPNPVIATPPSAPKQRRSWRIPEFAMSIGIFIVLTTLGIHNINASSASPAVLGAATSPTPTLSPSPIPSDSPSPIPTMTPVATESPTPATDSATMIPTTAPTMTPTPKTILMVQTSDGSGTKVYKSPAPDSDVVKVAEEGQVFEYTSSDSGWYRVYLEDGTGYIKAEDIKIIESNN